ncbi:MAG TPA: hypothetical protein VFJ02_09050 [Vicinamibacterales bacterium]|nr:hypothetical protein [Vicinamibacterales bacterium]
MPFKSQAQRRKFAQLLVEGKISNETFEEWNRETGSAALPERVRRPAAARKTRRTRGRKKKTPSRMRVKKTAVKKTRANKTRTRGARRS